MGSGKPRSTHTPRTANKHTTAGSDRIYPGRMGRKRKTKNTPKPKNNKPMERRTPRRRNARRLTNLRPDVTQGADEYKNLKACAYARGVWYSRDQTCRQPLATREGDGIIEIDPETIEIPKNVTKSPGNETTSQPLPPQNSKEANTRSSKNRCAQQGGVWRGEAKPKSEETNQYGSAPSAGWRSSATSPYQSGSGCYPPVGVPYGDGRDVGTEGYGDPNAPMVWIEGLFQEYDYARNLPQFLRPNPLGGNPGDKIIQEHVYSYLVHNDWDDCEGETQWNKRLPVPAVRARECLIAGGHCTKKDMSGKCISHAPIYGVCADWYQSTTTCIKTGEEGCEQSTSAGEAGNYYGEEGAFDAGQQRILDQPSRHRPCGSSGDGKVSLSPVEDVIGLEITSGGIFDRNPAQITDSETCKRNNGWWVAEDVTQQIPEPTPSQ